jgi:hypothetical protein
MYLHVISLLMRNLNEYIATKANKEDDWSGGLWEGRFKLQALPDEATIISRMTYVDFNSIRAKVTDTPKLLMKPVFKFRTNKSAHYKSIDTFFK